MTDNTLLHPGDQCPELTVARTGGGILRLPDEMAGHFGVILFYRGAWCPYCNAQLSTFQRSLDRITDIGASVAALSVDDETTTQDLIAKHGLRFPVGHSADANPSQPPRVPSSATTRRTSSRPASCLTPTAGWWSVCTPAAPSDGSSPATSLA